MTSSSVTSAILSVLEEAEPNAAVSVGEIVDRVIDILPALKREDSHGTAPLGWDSVVYDVTRS